MQLATSHPVSIVSRAITCVSELLLTALVIATLAASLHAQEFRATVTGQVADSTGSMIMEASITAVETATGQTYTSKTDSQGQYSLLYLLPGTYAITVRASNFEASVFKNVILESAQKRSLNVTLTPGTINQEVVVTSGNVLLDTVSASMGGVIDQVKVQNMPSTGREVWDDVGLTPGIRITSADPYDITPRNNGNKYAVAGVPVDANAFWVNGAPVSDQGSWYFTPEQDAAAEVQAAANPYDAQYGRTAGWPELIAVHIPNLERDTWQVVRVAPMTTRSVLNRFCDPSLYVAIKRCLQIFQNVGEKRLSDTAAHLAWIEISDVRASRKC